VSVVVISIVILIARTSLKLHSDSVSILSFIGATDEYVAKQFQQNAMLITLKGTAIGIGAAFITLVPLGLMASSLEWVEFPLFTVSFFHIFMMLVMLGFTTFVAFVASRTTVIRMLTSAT